MVLAIFSTNSSFVYMLSWVVLHKQFVGMRIIAVILSTTGISLLAYMDGIADNKTLAAVLIASGAAAGSAIYKVMFQKVMGAVSLGQAMMKRVNSQANFLILQVSLIISLIGILNMVVLWPVAMLLYLTGPGKVRYEKLCNILIDFRNIRDDQPSLGFPVWLCHIFPWFAGSICSSCKVCYSRW